MWPPGAFSHFHIIKLKLASSVCVPVMALPFPLWNILNSGGVQECQIFYVRPPSSYLISMNKNNKAQSVSRFRICFGCFGHCQDCLPFPGRVSFLRCFSFWACMMSLFLVFWVRNIFFCATSLSFECVISVVLSATVHWRFGGGREYWLFCENFWELLKLYLITRRPSSRKLKVSQKDTTANTPHCSGSGTNVLQDFCDFAKK